MKRIIIEVAAFLILLASLAGVTKYALNQKAEKERQSNNFESEFKAPGKTTAEFDVTKKEFKELFPEKARELDSLRGRRVQSFQKVVYKYSVDTILVPVPAENYPEPMATKWILNRGCLNAEIIKPDGSDSIELKLSGEVPLFIIVDLFKPKWYKFRQLLKPSGWPDSTRVETPCGLTIKENIKFNFIRK